MSDAPKSPSPFDKRTTQVILAAICLALVVADVVAAIIFPWWRARMVADFWPLDSSRIGPKIVGTCVQGVFAIIFVAVFWPPLRRRIATLLEEGGHRANRDLHRKLSEAHERMDLIIEHHAMLHEKLDHIIKHHPDIPTYGESTWIDAGAVRSTSDGDERHENGPPVTTPPTS